MIWWGIIWGAIIGGLWPRTDWGWIPGAILGFFAGLTLRAIVRSNVKEQSAQLHLQQQQMEQSIQALQAQNEMLMRQVRSGVVQPGTAQPIAPVHGDVDASTGVPPTLQPMPSVQPAAQPALQPGMQPASQAAAVAQPSFATNEQLAPPVIPATVMTGAAGADTVPRRGLAGATASTAQATTAVPVAIPKPAPTYAPIPPAPPAEPGAIEQGMAAIKNWFLGGNTVVRIGAVILFIGLAFLASLAAEAGLFPIQFRLSVIAAFAIGLLTVGFRTRTTKPGFGLTLQGAGVAVLYLTIFAAYKRYDLLQPMYLAFGLMVVVCVLSCVLALLQNSRALAVAAFAGGFATPIMLSTGGGSHIGLFAYYTLLNVAILFIATRRAWRVLHLVGFFSTFGVATLWGVLKYSPQNYASAQTFLLIFVGIYVLTAIMYARNTATKLGSMVDSILVFGTPLIGFGLQAGLVRHMEFGTAFSAVGFAAVFLVLAFFLARAAIETYRVLIECFLALGVGFATLAVPLALDARWTSAAWAVEGAGAFWVGMRQSRWMPRAFGLALQGVAALLYLGSMVTLRDTPYPFANPAFMGAMFIALPAFMIAWWTRQELAHSGSSFAKVYGNLEKVISPLVFLAGFGFWCLGWVHEAHRQVIDPVAAATNSYAYTKGVFEDHTAQLLSLLAIVVSAAGALWLSLRKEWNVAAWPSRVLLPLMVLILVMQSIDSKHVLYTPAWILWIAIALVYLWTLRQNDTLAQAYKDKGQGTLQGWLYTMHALGAWWLLLIFADCLAFWINRGQLWGTAWGTVILLVSGIAVLLLLVLWAGRVVGSDKTFAWPLQPHARAYYWVAAVPVAIAVFVGAFVAAVTSPGYTAPLPYIPLLNPTDLTIAMAFAALMMWRNALLRTGAVLQGTGWAVSDGARNVLFGAAFIALNTVWLRIAHHFFSVNWNPADLFVSPVVQTGYAILWSLLAMALMLIAKKRVSRGLWTVGAGLLGLVVVKLLFIDLANTGTASRIIAFIGVGVLMLVVGYIAPMPPKQGGQAQGGQGGGQAPSGAGPNPAVSPQPTPVAPQGAVTTAPTAPITRDTTPAE